MGSAVPPKEPELSAAPLPAERGAPTDHLRHAVEHAAHLLPAQGPITVFIHHNTLHAFEDLPFDEAVRRGAEVFGCQPYLSEERYRAALGRGRIRLPDLRAVLADDLGDRCRRARRRAVHPARAAAGDARITRSHRPGGRAAVVHGRDGRAAAGAAGGVAAARRRLIAETRRWVMRDLRGAGTAPPRRGCADLFARFTETEIEQWDEADWEAFALELLWARVPRRGRARRRRCPAAELPVRHRDLLLAATGVDTDLRGARPAHPVLRRVPRPGRRPLAAAGPRAGVLPRLLHALPPARPGRRTRGCAGWPTNSAASRTRRRTPLQSAADVARRAGRRRRPSGTAYLAATLLALRGWGGMIHQVEAAATGSPSRSRPGSLVEFLAVRLLLDRLALAARREGTPGLHRPARGAARRACGHGEAAGPAAGRGARRSRSSSSPSCSAGRRRSCTACTPDDWAALVAEVERSTGSSGGACSTWPTSGGSAPRASTRWPCTRRRRADRPAVPGVDLPRRARGVVPPAPGGGRPGLRDVRRRRVLRRGHVLPRGGRRPLRPAVPGGRHAEALGRGASRTTARSTTHKRTRRARRGVRAGAAPAPLGTRTAVVGAVLAAGVGVLAAVPLVVAGAVPAADGRACSTTSGGSSARRRTRLRLERHRGRTRARSAAAVGFTRRGDDRHRRAGAARHRADARLRPAGADPRARVAQHEQPARVGARLRGVRRVGRRAERPGHRADPERPAGAGRAGRRAGWRSRTTRCSSAGCTTPATST